jgi:hypothetical protein
MKNIHGEFSRFSLVFIILSCCSAGCKQEITCQTNWESLKKHETPE